MSLPIYVRSAAERDLEDAAAWYEKQQLGLGSEFLDEVARLFQRITEHPNLYPILYRHVHRALIRRFPFGVYYLQQANRVIVIAVLHGSRDPRHWKHRE